jgi:transcriptional regulator with XRE-family HTH domain
MAPKRETAAERFGRELRAACEAAGIHAKDLAKAISVAPSTLTNWMAGRHTPHPKDVERLEKVLKDKAPGYPEGYLKRYLKEWVAEEESPEWSEWMGVEHEATGLQDYENIALPGLLQSPAYAGVLLPPHKAEQRIERQRILDEGAPPFFEVLIDESVLYRNVGGPEVMADALGHLLKMGERDDIIVRVVPLAANSKGLSSQFVLATIRDGKELGWAEYAVGGQILEKPAEIAKLKRLWGKYSANALDEEETAELIRKAREQWNQK